MLAKLQSSNSEFEQSLNEQRTKLERLVSVWEIGYMGESFGYICI